MAADFLFQVFPTSGLPIYRQLVDQVLRHVASGRVQPGDFLPSVRQAALELEVNPMTVSKAYSQLERDGIVELRARAGDAGRSPPAPSTNGTLRERQDQLMPLVRQVAAEAYQLNLSASQVKSLIDRVLKERDAS